MRRKALCSVIGIIVLFVAGTSHAEGVKFSRLGAHGSISLGGDIEDSNIGFGAQTELSLTPHVSIELALSHFSDEKEKDWYSYDLDLTTIGISAVFRAPLAEKIKGYLLGGIDYNIADLDVNPNYDVPIVSASADVDDEVGFHLGGGLNFMLQKNWELFAEYRYTFLELNGDISYSYANLPVSYSLDEDKDFGLLKIGINYLF